MHICIYICVYVYVYVYVYRYMYKRSVLRGAKVTKCIREKMTMYFRG